MAYPDVRIARAPGESVVIVVGDRICRVLGTVQRAQSTYPGDVWVAFPQGDSYTYHRTLREAIRQVSRFGRPT